ncbi:MAG: pitrilysin family protein [Vampirovibrionales bacterium]|nr:pitrilysin family protein [Vampirovibrionales bacterium]
MRRFAQDKQDKPVNMVTVATRFAHAIRLNWSLPFAASLMMSIAFNVQSSWALPPEPVMHTLPSGQRVVLIENHQAPVVTVDTWIPTGSAHENATNNGVSHFLEHLLFKGSAASAAHPQALQSGDIDRLLERRGANFNAATSDDFTHYYITTPSAYLPEAIKLHAQMLLNAAFEPGAVDRERLVVQEEINRATDNPDHKLMMAASALLYGEQHPYALDTLGPKSLIASIPVNAIDAYYQCWYSPKNMVTVLAGDFDSKLVLAQLEQAFQDQAVPVADSAPVCTAPAIPDVQPPAQPTVRVLTHPQLSRQAKVFLVMPGVALSNALGALEADVVSEMLAGGKTARLVKSLREDKGWVTDVSAGAYSQRYGGLFAVSAELSPEKLMPVMREVLAQFETLKAQGITQDELLRVKDSTDRDFVLLNESSASTANTVGYYASLGQLEDYTQYRARVAQLDVDAVNAAARSLLSLSHAGVLVMLPETTPEAVQATVKSELEALIAQSAEILDATKAEKNGASASITPVAKDAEPKVTQLSQGPRVLVKALPNAETVSIQVMIPGGESVEPSGKQGVAALTAQMLTQGTQTQSAEALNRLLEDHQMRVSVSASADYTLAEGSAMRADWPLLLNTMVDVLRHPAFDAQRLAQERAVMLQALGASLDSPAAAMMDALGEKLYTKAHPYHGTVQQALAQLPKLSARDLQQYHQRWLSPERWIVSVAGNVSEDSVAQQLRGLLQQSRVQAQFNGLPSASDLPLQNLQNHQAAKKAVTLERPKLAATWIGLGWLGPSVSQTQDYVALKVVNSLMGTGMSSRLFRNMREKQGLAYQIGSSYSGKRLESAFVMYLGTDPKNEAQALKGFEAERQALLAGEFSDAELADAKSKLAGLYALGHESPSAQAQYLALFETLGLGAAFDAEFSQQVAAVTREDVLRVARRYLSAEPVTAIVRPKIE